MYDIPIYTIHDAIEPYKNGPIECGEYFLQDVALPFDTYNGERVVLPNAFYSHALVRKLLDYGYISNKNITHELRAQRKLRGDTFKDFVSYCYNSFGPKVGKELINRFIGSSGSKTNKSYAGFLTSSFDSVVAAWMDDFETHCTVNQIRQGDDELYIFKRHKETTKLENHTSIWRHVISIGVLKLIEACRSLKGLVVALSTDSVTIFNGPENTCPVKGSEEFEMKHMGHLKREEKVHIPWGNHTINFDPLAYVNPKNLGKGHIYHGIPGSGKTKKLLELAKPEDLVFCFTNKACENIRQRSNNTLNVRTFDSYFSGEKGSKKHCEMLKGKRVFVDEFSMVPNKWMTLLYKTFCKYGIEVFLFGDPNQCDPVDAQVFDYLNSHGIRQMCPGVSELKYIEGSSRYDSKTHSLLGDLINTGRIRNYEMNDITDTYKNICYYNKTKDRVNKSMCRALFTRIRVKGIQNQI